MRQIVDGVKFWLPVSTRDSEQHGMLLLSDQCATMHT